MPARNRGDAWRIALDLHERWKGRVKLRIPQIPTALYPGSIAPYNLGFTGGQFLGRHDGALRHGLTLERLLGSPGTGR